MAFLRIGKRSLKKDAKLKTSTVLDCKLSRYFPNQSNSKYVLNYFPFTLYSFLQVFLRGHKASA